MPNTKNPFEVLGISPKLVKELKHNDAVLLKIAQSMKKVLSVAFHPDRNPVGFARMAAINGAYDFIERNQQSSFYRLLKEEYSKAAKEPRVARAERENHAVIIVPRPLQSLEIVFTDGAILFIDACGALERASSKRSKWADLPGRFLIGTLEKSYCGVGAFSPPVLEISGSSANSRGSIPLYEANERFGWKILGQGAPTFRPITGVPEIDRYLLSGERDKLGKLCLFIEGLVMRVAPVSRHRGYRNEAYAKKH